jgi:hypothetical protein
MYITQMLSVNNETCLSILLAKSFPRGRRDALHPASANVMKSPPTLYGCATGLCSHIFSSHTPQFFPLAPRFIIIDRGAKDRSNSVNR